MGILCWVLQVYIFVLFGRIILSWFPMSGGSALAGVYEFLRKLTDPILEPLRRLIPPIRLGGAAIDLSPILVFFAIQLILLPIVC
ncbi:MAG: YggT family protein [Acidimicrobiales bacterium]